MCRKLIGLGFCLVALAASSAAQTNVTNNNDGTANTVPVYTGSSTLGNSPISVSGSSVGIGTTTPTNIGNWGISGPTLPNTPQQYNPACGTGQDCTDALKTCAQTGNCFVPPGNYSIGKTGEPGIVSSGGPFKIVCAGAASVITHDPTYGSGPMFTISNVGSYPESGIQNCELVANSATTKFVYLNGGVLYGRFQGLYLFGTGTQIGIHLYGYAGHGTYYNNVSNVLAYELGNTIKSEAASGGQYCSENSYFGVQPSAQDTTGFNFINSVAENVYGANPESGASGAASFTFQNAQDIGLYGVDIANPFTFNDGALAPSSVFIFGGEPFAGLDLFDNRITFLGTNAGLQFIHRAVDYPLGSTTYEGAGGYWDSLPLLFGGGFACYPYSTATPYCYLATDGNGNGFMFAWGSIPFFNLTKSVSSGFPTSAAAPRFFILTNDPPSESSPPTGSLALSKAGVLYSYNAGWNKIGPVPAPASGLVKLSSGTATVSTTAACNVAAGCIYKLANCGEDGSSAIGTLSVASATPGTSFVIDSLAASSAIATGDSSYVCWQID